MGLCGSLSEGLQGRSPRVFAPVAAMHQKMDRASFVLDLFIPLWYDPSVTAATETPRPVIPFSEDLAREICVRVSAGESLRAICRPREMPGAATVHRWAALRPDFRRRLDEAQRAARVDREDVHRRARADRAWKRQRPWARPDAYRPQIGETICRALAGGMSLLEVCAVDGMPATGTVYEWLRAHDDFARMYRQARRMQADLLADRAWEIAQSATHEDVKLARLQFDVIRWRAARVAPKAYRGEDDESEGVIEVYVQDFGTGAILSGPTRVGPGA